MFWFKPLVFSLAKLDYRTSARLKEVENKPIYFLNFICALFLKKKELEF